MFNKLGAQSAGSPKGKTLLRLAVAIGVLIGSATFSAAPANAQDAYLGILRNWATGRCLDLPRGTPVTRPCNFGDSQGWIIYPDGKIVHPHFGACLSDIGLDVEITLCDRAHAWRVTRTSGGNVFHIDTTRNNLRLDSNHAGDVYLHGANGGGFQDWKPGF